MRWFAPVLALCLCLLATGPASARLTLVDSGWVSNHTISIMWDSYEEITSWDELGPFKPFEDQVKQANELRDKFKSGNFKAIVLHVSMRNDSGKTLHLGFDVGDSGFCDASGQFWLGGADGSAFDSSGWEIGHNIFGQVTSGANLSAFMPDGMTRKQDAKPGDIVRGRVVMFVPKSFVPVELYVHTGDKHQWGTEALSIKPKGVPSASTGGGDPAPGNLYPPVNGTWTANGAVLCLDHELSTGKPVSVAGFWVKPGAPPEHDSIGAYIQEGTFNPSTGDLIFKVAPAGGSDATEARFKVAGDGKALNGKDVDAGSVKLSGDWHRLALKEALDNSDRAVLYGIYFDLGTASIKPASQPALIEIARMLRESPIRLRIEGYGNDSDNTLSQKQADAVKAYLVSKFSVDASRLDATGCGSDRPLADSATDAGKTLNNRIEVVKLK